MLSLVVYSRSDFADAVLSMMLRHEVIDPCDVEAHNPESQTRLAVAALLGVAVKRPATSRPPLELCFEEPIASGIVDCPRTTNTGNSRWHRSCTYKARFSKRPTSNCIRPRCWL